MAKMLRFHTTKPPFLQDRGLKLLLFGGKGGVGKTTCATATGVHLATHAQRDSFLLISTDPAHSVFDALAGAPPPSNLDILELDASACLEDFKAKHSQKLREIASLGTFLDNEDIGCLLKLSLPGMDELVGFLEISRLANSQRYRCVVVDTAPTGHMLSLLAMPDLMRTWLAALDALLAKHRYMKNVFSRACHRDEMDDFLEELAHSLRTMEQLLQARAQCGFVPVMLAEALSVSETTTLVAELERRQIPIHCIMVNRLRSESCCAACDDVRRQQAKELRQIHSLLSRYPLWALPLFPYEPRGLDHLERFWNSARRLTAHEGGDRQFDSSLPPASAVALVERPPELPAPDLRIILFAGKGGVGKTTLACATALRLVQELGDKKILLFSVDPAHSLSACLDMQVGPKPKRLSSRLTAIEIDATSEFEYLKAHYREELSEALASALPNLDLPFDRQAIERVMDLAPSGLDELMALSRVMAILEEASYDTVVIDTAPTGHLIRLLELPALIDQWLKAFFGILLKYERVVRLPKLSRRMIALSKSLKSLRTTLRDPVRSAVYVVSAPMEMVYEETKDLVAACEGMGIHVPVLFLNLATPAGDCPLCCALHQQESRVMQKFRGTFPDKHHTVVYRCREPRGLHELSQLGRILYPDARRKRKRELSWLNIPQMTR